MFSKERLKDALAQYKQEFVSKQWGYEKYKWIAVKCFQDNWDIHATDFGTMVEKSLSKTSNLLASMSNYPRAMITKFAKMNPEKVRAMFMDLFDDGREVHERILSFKSQAEELLVDFPEEAKQHFQNENAVTTYLWLRYPDKYYIYKYGEVKKVAEKLQSDYHFKKGAYAENIANSIRFYNEVSSELKQDEELVSLLQSQLTPECYPDPELKTLMIDVGFYISRFYATEKSVDEEKWFPADYSPNITKEQWKALLNDTSVFTSSSLEIMKRMKDYGGQATCKQLSVKYGESSNFYNSGSSSLARRIVEKTGCPVIDRDTESSRWWPVLYVGKLASKKEEGGYLWKLRDELSAALDEIDLDHVSLYANESTEPLVLPNESYSKEEFLREVYMEEAGYDSLVSVLKNKKNIILQGAPGVGKTFAANRLAYAIMGQRDDSRVEFIQFHQNYTYEDFMMGYKPTENGFALKHGVFYRFCQKAANYPEQDYFLIIDEINRGNLSKIFGELLMLIEKPYREKKITLAYHEIPFSVPENLYLIGLMNTADRSLAMMDYALRRRFSFVEMTAGFEPEGFRQYQKGLNSETFNELIDRIKELNKDIALDKSLGRGFCIGHSYFCAQETCSDEWLMEVVEYDILPMLSEYWFDDNAKLQRWENLLRGVFQ